MNCSTIRTPEKGHICKHDLEIDQSQWSHPLVCWANLLNLPAEKNFGETQLKTPSCNNGSAVHSFNSVLMTFFVVRKRTTMEFRDLQILALYEMMKIPSPPLVLVRAPGKI